MRHDTDVHVRDVSLYFLPVQTRVPLKFGTETMTSVTTARVRLTVEDPTGQRAQGWGETPLGVQWVWPSSLAFEVRQQILKDFCVQLAQAWQDFSQPGHPIEIGYVFLHDALPELLAKLNALDTVPETMPWLAALVCCSPFDIALHDAYATLHGVPVYGVYTASYMNHDLSRYIKPESGSGISFEGVFPADYVVNPYQGALVAWHLVGGKDLLHPAEADGTEPQDGYPVLLSDWIERDGLKCLKVKLRGNDEQWDYQRMADVGRIAVQHEVNWLSADFNCTVTDVAYVNTILDRLMKDEPRIYGMLLYVEQPFPYDLERNQIDVRSVSARKPLFMDESAHDWDLVRLGRRLGWAGVALKTCKTQTGALLTLAWAKAHGMTLMVQDLTNPMLAQIPHVLLAAHAGTIMGVETNSMQFYPQASAPEAVVHPGLYERRRGCIDLGSLDGTGFSYKVACIRRSLPEPAFGPAGDS